MKAAQSPAPRQRSLLVAPQWIGDAVMAQPLVAMLAARGERLSAIALPAVAPVLRAMPGIDEVIEAPFAHRRLDLGARLRLAAQLRGRGFDRAYLLGNNLKSRLVPWLAGIGLRIGWRGEAAGWMLSHCLREDSRDARLDMRLHYARLAGDVPGRGLAAPRLAHAPVVASDVPQPLLRLAQPEAADTAAQLGLRPPYVVLCPGAEYGPAKQWPAAHHAALAAMARRAGLQVVLVGSARERAVAASIVGQVAADPRGLVDLCGSTTLLQAMQVLAAASGVISNDSGLMHIAAALGRPTVGLYGSTDPRHTPPAARRSAALWLQLPCSPCFRRTCPLGHLNCLRALDPQWAWAELRRLMQDAGRGTPAP